MSIPPLSSAGLLPAGVHLATLAEIEQSFGRRSARRIELFAKLQEFLALARSYQLFSTSFVDGSFATDKADPGDITDPAARDIAVVAVRQLSPSGQLGITEIELLGRRIAATVSLTTETRRRARRLMAQPPSRAPVRASFVGTVRELDLDAARFEIRHVEGHPDDVRCAHELDEAEVKQLVDQRVRVAGTAEYGTRGVVRLLWVDEVERVG